MTAVNTKYNEASFVSQFEPNGRTITYKSVGEVLIIGPEHRGRLAASELSGKIGCTILVTEAMPAEISDEMEQAAQLNIKAQIHHYSLQTLQGYLGNFDAAVTGQDALTANSFAKLCLRKGFDLVLDLGRESSLGCELTPAGYYHCPDHESLQKALEELPQMVGDFSKPVYLKINNDICAHSNSHLTGCTRCLDVCPADAIHSNTGRIEIDHHLCHGVGGCASSCPTGAIEHIETPPSQLLEKLRSELPAANPVLVIHDQENGRALLEQISTKLEAQPLRLELEEINCAGLETWMSALAWGARQVVILTSSDIPASALSALQTQLMYAQALLQGMEFDTSRITLINTDDRERLLQLLDTQVAPLSHSGYLPGNRRRDALYQAIDELFSASSQSSQTATMPADSPFGSLQIDSENCTLCMSCAGVCPTQAIQAGGDTPKLMFTQHNCVQCNLCASACPEQVLSLKSEYLFDAKLRKSQQTLHEEAALCCGDCGTAFTTQSLFNKMREQLSGHDMFQGNNANLLELCANCRVKAMMHNQSELIQ